MAAKRKTPDKSSKLQVWLTLFSSGLVIAIFGFAADKIWQAFHHRPLDPKYLHFNIHVEENILYVLVRNDSDEPLDLVKAQINIKAPALRDNHGLGLYPDASKIYSVVAISGNAALSVIRDEFQVQMGITQVIPPKQIDKFGFRLTGPATEVNLSPAQIHAAITDIHGHIYQVEK